MENRNRTENPRRLALDVLGRVERGQYANLALDAALERAALSAEDRALATTLVYGVLEKQGRLDFALAGLSSRPVEELSPDVRALLRLGLYQLCFLDRVPDHAAVNETVALASRKTAGYVNAVLREEIRRGKTLPLPGEDDRAAWLAVRYSVSQGLAERLLADLGNEKATAFLNALETPPPLTLRVNTLRTEREKLLDALQKAGFDAHPTARSRTGILLPRGAAVRELPGFDEGLFFVQDEASQLAVEALDARPGMRAVDVCACPGSKSFGIAMEMENRGEVLACDLHASKLSLVSGGAERLGIGILSVLARDARKPMAGAEGSFDRVLCDVPCSGFGVIGKKPELRRKDPRESAGLPAIQAAILVRSAELLRVGGRLVYSTCTVLPAENGENVAHFLADNGNFRLLSERTFYPDTDGTDGFFIAAMEKIR